MADITPVTREEQFLNAAKTGNTNDLPAPVTRTEKYLSRIARGGSGGGLNYSTTEQNTGTKWLDDKDIYVKTVITTVTSSRNTWINSIDDIYRVIKIEGFIFNDTDTSMVMLPYGAGYNYGDSAIRAGAQYSSQFDKICPLIVNSWSAMYDKTAYLTVYYTKTTD